MQGLDLADLVGDVDHLAVRRPVDLRGIGHQCGVRPQGHALHLHQGEGGQGRLRDLLWHRLAAAEAPVGTDGLVVVSQQGVVGLGLLVLVVLPDGQHTRADRIRQRIRFPGLRRFIHGGRFLWIAPALTPGGF